MRPPGAVNAGRPAEDPLSSPPPPSDEPVRLDRWLVAARMFKTRPVAQAHCEGGHVKLNGKTAGSSKAVRVGDEVDAVTPGGRRVWRVLAVSVRRGPPALARLMYEDHSPPPVEDPVPVALRERGTGRPTKREARESRRLKGR